jgi:hypothetical protein
MSLRSKWLYTHSTNFVYLANSKVSHTEIIDLSNLFSDIMYPYKTSKSGPTMEKHQKVSPHVARKARNRVLMYVVKKFTMLDHT